MECDHEWRVETLDLTKATMMKFIPTQEMDALEEIFCDACISMLCRAPELGRINRP